MEKYNMEGMPLYRLSYVLATRWDVVFLVKENDEKQLNSRNATFAAAILNHMQENRQTYRIRPRLTYLRSFRFRRTPIIQSTCQPHNHRFKSSPDPENNKTELSRSLSILTPALICSRKVCISRESWKASMSLDA